MVIDVLDGQKQTKDEPEPHAGPPESSVDPEASGLSYELVPSEEITDEHVSAMSQDNASAPLHRNSKP